MKLNYIIKQTAGFMALLLLLVLLMRKRKAQEEAEKHLRMARALAEEEPVEGLEMASDSFEGLDVTAPSVTLSPAVVAASAAAAAAAEKPAVPVTEPVLEPDATAALLAEVEQSVESGRLNHAAELLELQPKARITGNVHYKALEMHQGGMIAGQMFPSVVLVEEKPPLQLASNNP